jgi:hypothetical protein
MRHLTAIVTVVLLACLGLAGTANAQAQQPLQLQGTIQAVDCPAQQLTLYTSGGPATLQVTGQTAIFLNGTPTSLCSLQASIGAPATGLVVPSGSEFVLGQIDVGTPQDAAPPAPASVEVPGASSLVGVAFGAFLLGGLVSLIAQSAASSAHQYSAPPRSYRPDSRCPRDARTQWCR